MIRYIKLEVNIHGLEEARIEDIVESVRAAVEYEFGKSSEVNDVEVEVEVLEHAGTEERGESRLIL